MMLENHGLNFHHLGYAVSDIPAALKVVRRVWCAHDTMPAVELVAPTDNPGPIDNILEHCSESIYHTCYRASNIEKSVSAIKGDGIRVLPVASPKPAVLFGGRRVGFYQLRGFGLIEIVEEP